MFNIARIVLTLAFLFWSLLLLGGSGLVGWIGDGLAGWLAQANLGWLANVAAGLGKAVILIIWIISAIVFAVFFAISGRLAKAAQDATRAAATYQQRQGSGNSASGGPTITLARDNEGRYQ